MTLFNLLGYLDDFKIVFIQGKCWKNVENLINPNTKGILPLGNAYR